MSVFGITDANVISGDYVSSSSGVQHGFVGPFNGSNYTSFDDGGGTTQPRGMNNKGYIAGYDITTLTPWERTPGGTLTDVTKKGTTLNQLAQGMNKHNVFAGNYDDTSGVSVGYLGKNAKFMSKIRLPISNSGVAGRGVDAAGDVTGWFIDTSTGLQHAYLIIGGTATQVDYPAAKYTVGEGLNDKGIMSGQYEDSSSLLHGFIYKISTGKFTALDIPGGSNTQVWGISNSDVVAASYPGAANGYVYCMKATTCPAPGVEVVEKEITVPLKSMPHYPCVNGCRTPLAPNAIHVGSWMPRAPQLAPGKFCSGAAVKPDFQSSSGPHASRHGGFFVRHGLGDSA